MPLTKNVKITARGDRELVITRVFHAPKHLVFQALTRPEYIKRWLLGPDGWMMPVCEVDLRVGGKYRYVWRKDKTGQEMGMGGEFREIVPNERLVSTEKFDDPWYPGEGLGTTILTEKDGVTTMTHTMRYESKEARDAVLASPMEQGVEASYNRLAEMLPGMAT